MIFEAVQILVPLAAELASVRFLLFHSQRAWVRSASLRIDYGEGSIAILMELLIGMSMLYG